LLAPFTAERFATAGGATQQKDTVMFAAAVVDNGKITRHAGIDHAGKEMQSVSAVLIESRDSD
jgi:hypothetical protein